MNDNLTRMKDAKLLLDAMRRTCPGTRRHDFLVRLQRSFHEWGELTPVMRDTIRPRLSMPSS